MPDAIRVYRWHIDERVGSRMKAGLPTDMWKRSLDHYVMSASQLLRSMEADGFSEKHPIPIGPDGEFLQGAHRIACAIALGVDLYVNPVRELATAPPWDYSWFESHGMAASDLRRISEDWRTISAGSPGQRRVEVGQVG